MKEAIGMSFLEKSTNPREFIACRLSPKIRQEKLRYERENEELKAEVEALKKRSEELEIQLQKHRNRPALVIPVEQNDPPDEEALAVKVLAAISRQKSCEMLVVNNWPAESKKRGRPTKNKIVS
jgi:hypothetical protein